MKKLLLLLLLVSGNAWAVTDKCLQEKLFFKCLEVVPKISRRDSKLVPKIISECEVASHQLAFRAEIKTIPRECRDEY